MLPSVPDSQRSVGEMRRQEQTGTHAIFLRLLLADEEYFHHIYDTYFQKIYNYIYTRVWDHAETKRLVEKTFLTAIDGTDLSIENSTLDCWVYHIIKHVLEEDGFEAKEI